MQSASASLFYHPLELMSLAVILLFFKTDCGYFWQLSR